VVGGKIYRIKKSLLESVSVLRSMYMQWQHVPCPGSGYTEGTLSRHSPSLPAGGEGLLPCLLEKLTPLSALEVLTFELRSFRLHK